MLRSTLTYEQREARRERDLKKIVRYCERWGVPVVPIGDDNGKNEPAPKWHLGPTLVTFVRWPEREIHVERDSTILDPGAIIHELAHCLAEDSPSKVDEPNSLMLAFEYHSHRFLRVAGWSNWMRDYSLPPNSEEWEGATLSVRRGFLARSREKAILAGVLDRENRPTFKRPDWARLAA